MIYHVDILAGDCSDESRRAEAHTMYTVAFRYFRTKIKKKHKKPPQKHETTFTTLKHAQVHCSAEQNLFINSFLFHCYIMQSKQ